MGISKCLLAVMFSLGLASELLAESLSPVGLWNTVDDKTGEAKSFVRVWSEHGELLGKIEKLIRKPGQNPDPVCSKCAGDKKDKPITGMTIMWGLAQDGDAWAGGYILDPNNGKTYRCKVKLEPGGSKLSVRGYMGFSLFGRSQTWLRVE